MSKKYDASYVYKNSIDRSRRWEWRRGTPTLVDPFKKLRTAKAGPISITSDIEYVSPSEDVYREITYSLNEEGFNTDINTQIRWWSVADGYIVEGTNGNEQFYSNSITARHLVRDGIVNANVSCEINEDLLLTADHSYFIESEEVVISDIDQTVLNDFPKSSRISVTCVETGATDYKWYIDDRRVEDNTSQGSLYIDVGLTEGCPKKVKCVASNYGSEDSMEVDIVSVSSCP